MVLARFSCWSRFLVVLVAVLSASSAAWAGGAVNWEHSFMLQGQGRLDNPLVRVGFNPQPDPPGFLTSLDLSDPTMPRFTRQSPGGNPADSFFDVFFAVGGGRTQFEVLPMAIPSGNFGSVGFSASLPAVQSFFDIFFDVSTSGGGQGTGAVSMNPQPEVPSSNLFGPLAYGGFSFKFTSFSVLSVQLRVSEGSASYPVSFAPAAVPEPGTCATMLAGLVVLGVGARRRRKSPEIGDRLPCPRFP